MITALVVIAKLLLYVAVGHGVYRVWLYFSQPSNQQYMPNETNETSRWSRTEYREVGTYCSRPHGWHTNAFGFCPQTRMSVVTLFWWSHTIWPILLVITGGILLGRGVASTVTSINHEIVESVHQRFLPKPMAPENEFQEEAEQELEEYLNAS